MLQFIQAPRKQVRRVWNILEVFGEHRVNPGVRFLRKPLGIVGVVLLAGLLFWGARSAYCHLHGKMVEARPSETSAAEERMPVVIAAEPTLMPAVRTVTLAASVEAFEVATLYAKVAGYLKWIKVDKGDAVRKGNVLALIEVPEMEKEYQGAQARVQEAEAASERAAADATLKQLTFERLAGVRQTQPNVISQQEVDVARAALEVAQADARLAKARLELARSELEKLKTLMEYAQIRSPYDGVVTERFVDPGALIQTGTSSKGNPIVTVASVDWVRVYVDVPERDVPYVTRRDSAGVLLDAFPGKVFDGHVSRFATAIDSRTRTMKAEIDLRNPAHLIRPGMYGTARLKLGTETNAVFLPAQSVRRDAEGKNFVYVVAQARIRKVPVETGLDDGKLIQVKGLRGDEIVVLTATVSLQESMEVRVVKASP
jgi:RND family efflux transporter MFP subunit